MVGVIYSEDPFCYDSIYGIMISLRAVFFVKNLNQYA